MPYINFPYKKEILRSPAKPEPRIVIELSGNFILETKIDPDGFTYLKISDVPPLRTYEMQHEQD
jgi:hypothetical protein